MYRNLCDLNALYKTPRLHLDRSTAVSFIPAN